AHLLRIPFLYVVALYYGHLVTQARQERDKARRVEKEKRELEAFVEVTSATNSTLDLHQVLYLIVRRIATLVDARRCSVMTVEEMEGVGRILASSDDPTVRSLPIELRKYPEIQRAIETRQPVVINDVAQEKMLAGVRDTLQNLGFRSIMVLPLMAGEDLLGMLLLRAARRQTHFTPDEIAACQVVANASANAIRNATLFEQIRGEARSRKETAHKLQNILDHF